MSENGKSCGMKLGFGLMRLPRLADGSMDIAQISEMVDHFMAAGGTYFDTAYVYEGSEEAIRKALVERCPRDSYQLVSKLNPWLHNSGAEEAKHQIYESLERTGAGYFDYYLLHAIQDKNFARFDELGLWDYVKELKAKGLVKHIGFSFHGGPELLDRLLKEHPEVELVQLQINYMDMENPDVQSRACYETARRYGKPVTIMEPVKGGALADPPKAVRDVLTAAEPDMSPASWAIRYAASMDGILAVLSGMSDLAQMDDNLSYMKDFRPLDAAEHETILRAKEAFDSIPTIACTACHYCTDGCPQQIPIPEIFSARNKEMKFNDLRGAKRSYELAVKDKAGAADCIACGQCESACPQQLPVIRLLEECAALLG
ncbi:MAG: aldo/keto reductase [Lachnospiraceae bacterium]|nr:aldo/keto reductase [Lachnospiraceae bacterium]